MDGAIGGAKALKYDRKWLRRAERCAAAAAELVERVPTNQLAGNGSL